ncbi:MAG: hypothetical protein Q4G70_01820 [Pseudomonadota bacterium]|nr:hypothetical protein [Pseudomonadota bacterium]
MKSTVLLAAIALLTVTACSPLTVGDLDHEPTHAISGYDHGMVPVSNSATARDRAHGWRYFSDPATLRAVVISPQGDYYLSRGRGLRWVAGTQTVI